MIFEKENNEQKISKLSQGNQKRPIKNKKDMKKEKPIEDKEFKK